MFGRELTPEQYEVLLKPLAGSRVATRSVGGQSLAYLEAWDVKAHLIRIFGFGGWSWDVKEATVAYEQQNEKGRWEVGYRVVGCLLIHSLGCSYTEAAVGFATLGARGEAHDMAVKTGESDALKRASINLGTQFGLSLYNNGSRQDVVGHTLVHPGLPETLKPVDTTAMDVVEGVWRERLALAKVEDDLRELWEDVSVGAGLDIVLSDGATMRGLIGDAVVAMREAATND